MKLKGKYKSNCRFNYISIYEEYKVKISSFLKATVRSILYLICSLLWNSRLQFATPAKKKPKLEQIISK
ncbi:hypothetical protein Fmac_025498 [Flemingia macrophylla]|uniref:Uncharacterized protein n=1 Tax=Flemingia macrophylla TaxID=520843 RepID=A0ABD1LSG2_9FABA